MLIYDEIGNDQDLFPVNPTAFAVALNKLSGVSELVLRMNCPGGDVFAGVAMYNAFRQFPGKKIVQVDGICASIATVIAMGADEVIMAESSMFMVHNPWGIAIGDAPKLRARADDMDNVAEATMIPAYARSGKSVDEIKAIMAKGIYYSAQQAKSEGWADSILDLPKPERLAARVSFDLRAFENAPKLLAKAVDGCTCPCGPCVDGDCANCTDENCDCEGCTCADATASAKSRKMAADATASLQQTACLAARHRERTLSLAEYD